MSRTEGGVKDEEMPLEENAEQAMGSEVDRMMSDEVKI